MVNDTNINEKIISLQQEIESQVNKIKYNNANVLSLSVNALESIKTRLDRIKQLLEIDKFKLVFVGKVGSGKTTAICNILNLIDDIKENQSNIHKLPLLKTGSGRVTLGEVIIKQAQKTYIDVINKDEHLVKKDIEDFCSYYWYSNKNKNTDEEKRISIDVKELARAIRNMAGFDSDEILKKYIDEFKGDFNEFKNYIIDKINLPKRIKTNIVYDENEEKNIKAWIRKTTDKINSGKFDEFSIPEQVYIYIDKKRINLNLPSYIEEIIDTRGIDGTDRADLDSYISQSDDVICLFTDEIESLPSASIKPFIKRYLTEENKDIRKKVGIVVLYKGADLKNVEEANGDELKGESLKLVELKEKIISERINYRLENTCFYDSYKYYKRDQDGEIFKFDSISIDNDRKRVLNSVESIIANRKKELVDEVEELYKKYSQIIVGNPLSDESRKVVNDTINNIVNISNVSISSLNINLDSYTKRYMDYLENINASKLRAVNNRFGKYDEKGINIYTKGNNLALDILSENVKPFKNEIIKYIKGSTGNSSELNILFSTFIDQINLYYEEFLENVSNEASLILLNSTFQHKLNNFWQVVIDRWGKGSGFKEYVIGKYENRIIEDLFINTFKTYTENQIRRFFEKVKLLFF